MPELRHPRARATRETRPAAPAELVEGRTDRAFVVIDNGVAVRRLVRRETQPIQRERVLVGRRSLLLDQAAEDAQLHGVEVHGRSVRSAGEAERRSSVHSEAVEREEAAVVRTGIVEPGAGRRDVERREIRAAEEAARRLLRRYLELFHQLARR